MFMLRSENYCKSVLEIYLKTKYDFYNVFRKLYLFNTSFFLCVVISV